MKIGKSSKLHRHYGYTRFIVSRYGQRPEQTSDEGKKWDQIIEKMIKVMRFKNLSLDTEKTYTGWNRQFQGFLNGRAPTVLSSDDIRSYFHIWPSIRRVPYGRFLCSIDSLDEGVMMMNTNDHRELSLDTMVNLPCLIMLCTA